MGLSTVKLKYSKECASIPISKMVSMLQLDATGKQKFNLDKV